MAGGHDYLKPDPAIDRWALMRENVFQNFKFNRRTARLSLIWGALVPFGTYLLLSNNDRKHDFLGKRRDESLLRVPPPAAAATADDE